MIRGSVDGAEGLVAEVAASALRALAEEDLATLPAVLAGPLRRRDDVLRHACDRRAWTVDICLSSGLGGTGKTERSLGGPGWSPGRGASSAIAGRSSSPGWCCSSL